ncbi:hypothetical protein P3T37_002893 [Kitasatospora sp. MAA4]|uniref:hypothetical protein n=1 Tax=Kitasatospora sp. MAA4 TaxID=3035093 RepID=UPI002475C295|nr:hypothetical protein [Kitasatospora sp. MAA4]MDH6133497.1 hypothetical protein [Kitasatospora sp. MAA4]
MSENPQQHRRPAGRPADRRPTDRRPAGFRGRAGAPPVPLVQPVALAVAADPVDFRRLSRDGILGGIDYPQYLERTQGQLRAALGQGIEVHLRVLEPFDFADFCAAYGLAPQDPAARVAYAADPELAGEPFVYDGAALAELLPALVADHLARVRISLAYQELLDAAGPPGGSAGPAARSAAGLRVAAELLEYVGAVYLALLAGLGEGCHRLVLRFDGPGGGGAAAGGAAEPVVTAELCAEHGRRYLPAREAEAFCVTLAAGFAAGRVGGLLVYSARPGAGAARVGRSGRGGRSGRSGQPGRSGGPGSRARERPQAVRGWALAAGRLLALDADGVRAALARPPSAGVDGVGEPSGVGGLGGPVRVRAGFALPDPPDRGGMPGAGGGPRG